MTILLSAMAIGLFAIAAATDVARRRIANRLVVALALVGGLRLVADWNADLAVWDVGAGLAVFGVGAALYRFGVMGGGDVKLLAAGTLWLGAAHAPVFVTMTALAGGALALGFLVWGAVWPGPRASLPYGVAIAAAGIWGTLATL